MGYTDLSNSLVINMMKLCLLVLVALSATQAFERCPWFAAKTPFDASKFAGQWYNIGFNERADHPEVHKCLKVSVVSAEVDGHTSLTYDYESKVEDKIVKAQIVSQTFKPGFPGLFYGVWKGDKVSTWSEPYVTSIIATDYETYAVVAACAPNYDAATNHFGRSLYTQIFSRTTSLPEETYKTLKNILTGYDIKYENIKSIDHTDC